jgi:hypothetical protein
VKGVSFVSHEWIKACQESGQRADEKEYLHDYVEESEEEDTQDVGNDAERDSECEKTMESLTGDEAPDVCDLIGSWSKKVVLTSAERSEIERIAQLPSSDIRKVLINATLKIWNDVYLRKTRARNKNFGTELQKALLDVLQVILKREGAKPHPP